MQLVVDGHLRAPRRLEGPPLGLGKWSSRQLFCPAVSHAFRNKDAPDRLV